MDSLRIEAGQQPDQAMIRILELFIPDTPGKAERLEMELIINHASMMTPPSKSINHGI